MDQADKVAFIHSQIVCANAEIAGMQAANLARMAEHQPLVYDEQAFYDVPSKYGLHHNDVISYLADR